MWTRIEEMRMQIAPNSSMQILEAAIEADQMESFVFVVKLMQLGRGILRKALLIACTCNRVRYAQVILDAHLFCGDQACLRNCF